MIADGYKDTEVGVIPIEWDVVELDNIVEFKNGKGHEQVIDENGQYIVVNSKFISTNGNVYKSSNSNLSPLKSNDITLVMSDIPNGKALAKCFYINEDDRYTLNQRICSLTAIKDNPLYLFYRLNRNEYFLKFNDGVNQTNLRKNEVLECKIPLPPLKEQEKIAEILSTADDKIDAIQIQIDRAEILKKGLLQKLLSEGIGHSEFKDSELGKIPDSWKVVRVGHICNLTAGGTPSTAEKSYWSPKEVSWLSSGEVNKRKIFYTDNKISNKGLDNSSAKLLPKNSVLIALAGQGKTRGTVAITEIELTTNQSVAAILPSDKIIPYYLYFNLASRYDELRNLSTGSGGRGGLNLAILKSVHIQLPPLEEQKQIAEILSTADEKLEILRAKKEKYETLKKGLLQKLLSGEVRV